MPIFVRFEFMSQDGGEPVKAAREFSREYFLEGNEGRASEWAHEAFMFLTEEWMETFRGLGYYWVGIQEEEGINLKILGEAGAYVETVPDWANP